MESWRYSRAQLKSKNWLPPGGASLWGVQLLPLESLDGGVKASGGRRVDERDSMHQLSLHGDDDV
jgi:hypothetical protein